MAKKQSADAAETKPAETDAANQESKPEPKKRTPKAKPGADAPAPEAIAAAPDAAAPAPVKVTGPSEKKKSKKPGVAPARGKKLRNQLRNQRQKIEKEGVTSLKK